MKRDVTGAELLTFPELFDTESYLVRDMTTTLEERMAVNWFVIKLIEFSLTLTYRKPI